MGRRRFLAAGGAGSLAATAGCIHALSDAVGPSQGHVYHRDADLSGDAGPWPTTGADARRSGAVEGSAPPEDAKLRQVTAVGQFVRAQPAVAGTRAYLGVDRRTGENGDEFSGIIAIDLDADRPDGRVAWREKGSVSRFTPKVAGNTVVAPLDEGMGALDAHDGTVYWRNTLARGAIAVVDETCYSYSEELVALDAVTGETRWTSEATEAAAQGFAVSKDAVALACGDGSEGSLYCFERSDGSTRWRYRDVGESYASAVTDGEQAYVVGTDGVLHAVTLARGEQAWTRRFDGDSYQRVAVSEGTVYTAGTNDNRLVAADAASGDLEWQAAVGPFGLSTPVITPDALVAIGHTQEGRQLFVLDRANGTERHRHRLPDGVGEPIQPVVADGVAYVLAEPAMETQGYLYEVG